MSQVQVYRPEIRADGAEGAPGEAAAAVLSTSVSTRETSDLQRFRELADRLPAGDAKAILESLASRPDLSRYAADEGVRRRHRGKEIVKTLKDKQQELQREQNTRESQTGIRNCSEDDLRAFMGFQRSIEVIAGRLEESAMLSAKAGQLEVRDVSLDLPDKYHGCRLWPYLPGLAGLSINLFPGIGTCLWALRRYVGREKSTRLTVPRPSTTTNPKLRALLRQADDLGLKPYVEVETLDRVSLKFKIRNR